MLAAMQMLLDDNEEKEAFETLYDRYRNKMFQIAFSILRDVQFSEDAVADAFFSIATHFKRIAQLPADARIGYCVIVTRNAALNIRDRKQLRKETLYPELESPPRRVTGLQQTQVENRETIAEVMQEIPVEQRDCILLRYYFGFSVRAIADMLHIPSETVRSRLRRGKKALRELYPSDALPEQLPSNPQSFHSHTAQKA